MGDQRGTTLFELLLSVAVLSLISSLAGLSAVGFVSSARAAKEASGLADGISQARERAIGRYERWRIRFLPNPAPGSTVVRSYVLESCPVPVGAAGPVCDSDSDWTVQATHEVEPGTGLLVPSSGGDFVRLTFDRTGLFLNVSDVQIQVCRVATQTDGAQVCRSGGSVRLVRVRQYSGIIET